MMNNKTIYFSVLTSALLLNGLSAQLHAESMQRNAQGVSYSYDHWPKRWSSAIHQQKDTRFPTRQKPHVPAQMKEESVSEQDLFYLPYTARSHGFDSRQHRRDGRLSRNRYMRDVRRTMPRDSAYAYYEMQPIYPQAGFGHGYGGFGMNPGPIGIDPVMGSPGNGIPVMPGSPYGFPAPGFYGMNSWGSPYSRW